MGSLMQKGMGMWKEMLDSPDMQAMLSNPEQMREMMLPFVEMMGGDTAKLDEVLADPEKLKASMNEGLEVTIKLLIFFPASSIGAFSTYMTIDPI